ncbi:hypothetical protein HIM_02987 [Hirsutella minnesotensis 3608]|nr:hypothetical protein HIM_02987 [Hirsutella minnesotensis 3608]
MATAVHDVKFDSLSLDSLASSSLSSFKGTRLYDIRAFDPTSPLTIPEPVGPRATTKTNRLGIPGEMDDMLPVYEACLRVGKLDRAALVLKRLTTSGHLSLEEQAVLNNQYLRATLDQLRINPDRKRIDQLHRWFETQIRSKGTPLTAETIACMLKVSLLHEHGPKLRRLIGRYMWLAPGEGGERVLGMTNILNDSDIQAVTKICPEYSYLTEPDDFDTHLTPARENEAREAEILEDDEQAACVLPQSGLIETRQKGVNLNLLMKDLGVLSSVKDVDIATLSPDEQREFQLLLERGTIDSAIARWRQAMKRLRKMCVKKVKGSDSPDSLASHIASWLPAMEDRIKEEVKLVEIAEAKSVKSELDLERCIFGPFLRQCDPARLAALTILTVLNLGALNGIGRGLVVSTLITTVSRLIQEDIEAQQRDKERKDKNRVARKRIVEFKKQRLSGESGSQDAAEAPVPPVIDPSEAERSLRDAARKPWSMHIKAHVGSILIKSLIETAKIKVTVKHPETGAMVSQYQPAFTHMSQPRKGRKVGVLVLNEALSKKMQSEPTGDYLAKHLPMVVPPKPWSGFTEGGLLDTKTNLVRVKPGDREQTRYTEAAIKSGDMDQVLKGLDVLGKTAWRINTQVLDVMKEAWNDREAVANLPPMDPKFELPPEPDMSSDPRARIDWMQQVKTIENKKSSLHSQRCFMNLQLEIADAFRNQTIYFPHNIDYRGRAYPMPAYLNHMGADHTRAILRFAKGKELGARGLRWLKIHLANVYGMDKSSFDERESFTTENTANVIDSATQPLKGSRWWLQAEDPWQCLAACFELKAALDLPDPTKYISNLPVHQDGTCNGLQHYAALGGDSWGAKQVNLEPGERPADVYSAVADLVRKAIDKDADIGVEFAKTLQGKITRKVVKQTVMTNVYGVTFAGAKLQVCKQLDALYPDLGKSVGTTNVHLSIYVAKLIFEALASMFRGAHDIQYWLGNVGGRATRALTSRQLDLLADSYEKGTAPKILPKGIEGFREAAADFRSTIIWTTPLRMPVVQPYRKGNSREVRTCLQAVVYNAEDVTDPVHRRKQLQAFPPNFIHSLDASHMMLSALQCNEKGLDFAAVHDSFWTHAGDVDTMNLVLRDSFIRIHEEDAIARLASEFAARHRGSLYLANIDSSSPVATRIKAWRKDVKLTYQQELLLEYKRQKLLGSKKAEDVELGRQIITPASLYEAMSASEEDVSIKEDVDGIGLGEIPKHEFDALQGICKQTTDKEQTTEVEQTIEQDGEIGDSSASNSAEMAERLQQPLQQSPFQVMVFGSRKRAAPSKAPGPRNHLPLWMPLVIPPIPKKGDFDVKRLRDSQYFFS